MSFQGVGKVHGNTQQMESGAGSRAHIGVKTGTALATQNLPLDTLELLKLLADIKWSRCF